MKSQLGLSLTEVLVSLLLTSIIMTTLIQLYLSSKHQYVATQALLEQQFDLIWVTDLLSDSIRRAGFTPCLGINQLKTLDTRNAVNILSAVKILNSPTQSLQINRMNEVFSTVINIEGLTKIRVGKTVAFKEQRPVLIADCDHAEVHQILTIDKLKQGYLLHLTKPLMFSYPGTTYVGEWLEEKWFIKKNAKGESSLYYHLAQTEELTTFIHSLTIKLQKISKKQLVEVVMGLEDENTQKLIVAVRGA